MMLLVLGYSFNRDDGRIEQGGLLQFGTTPSGAKVLLNGDDTDSRTTAKSTVPSGTHTVRYELDRYRPWEKTILIKPAQVGWINYARLIPNETPPQAVRTFEKIQDIMESPKRSYILVNEDTSKPQYTVVDIRADEVQYVAVAIPESVYTTTGSSHRFTLVSWSENENAALVKHTYGKSTEWLLLDRDEPEESLNITKMFKIDSDKLSFAGGNERLLFEETGKQVRRLNLDNGETSVVLASDYADLKVYDEKTVIYTTPLDQFGALTVGFANLDLREQLTIRTHFGSFSPFYADMGTYFHERYIATVRGNQLIIDKGTLPSVNSTAVLKRVLMKEIPEGAKNVEFSSNGRFVVVEYADGFATYDLELAKFDEVKWHRQEKKQLPLEWLDEYMVWSANGDMLRVYDFDGANQQDIMPVTNGMPVTLNPDGEYIYGVLQTDDGYELRRATLRL